MMERQSVRHGSHKFIDTMKVKKRVRPACQKTLDVLPETDRTVDLANLIHVHLFCMGKYAQVLMLTQNVTIHHMHGDSMAIDKMSLQGTATLSWQYMCSVDGPTYQAEFLC